MVCEAGELVVLSSCRDTGHGLPHPSGLAVHPLPNHLAV